MGHLSFNQIVIDIMVVFMILGGFDFMTKKKFNLGMADDFEEGKMLCRYLRIVFWQRTPHIIITEIPHDYNYFVHDKDESFEGSMHVIYCDIIRGRGEDIEDDYRFMDA